MLQHFNITDTVHIRQCNFVAASYQPQMNIQTQVIGHTDWEQIVIVDPILYFYLFEKVAIHMAVVLWLSLGSEIKVNHKFQGPVSASVTQK